MAQKKAATANSGRAHAFEIETLNQAYAWGNFHSARGQAKAILANSDASDVAKLAAQKMLKMTSIDPVALLVGVLCAVFTVAVAFVVGA